ncbi:hypothetical protein [Amycolatopsis sp. DSM 110486]|uniref:hypothetical protein n=1 Tax=Amycolatopsis sp. DSM 110486 TaxID=2865832 RepID=UPI001C69B6C2|nr:hypothetical protein [Amycolatopsis sp. DSM 110486]QYN21013.1 hypothetical protein K1T34_52790 [Amycolatopsis sp. DSM 110486]QYN26672.1 hypothetical protein K1T34_52810 [Amycolatopsis sp. DSM 110486]
MITYTEFHQIAVEHGPNIAGARVLEDGVTVEDTVVWWRRYEDEHPPHVYSSYCWCDPEWNAEAGYMAHRGAQPIQFAAHANDLVDPEGIPAEDHR